MDARTKLLAHLGTGGTTTCNCWAISRADGVVLGFTDHDRRLRFDQIDFLPESGVSGSALQQTTGLSVNNAEALGVLRSDSISERDIAQGRYDLARVQAWLVNWAAPAERMVLFAGTIGEISRGATGFVAELRGLSDGLNQRRGAIYQKSCPAVLGDERCGVDLDVPGYAASLAIASIGDGTILEFPEMPGYAEKWFAHGRLRVESGAAKGLAVSIKRDRTGPKRREIELWQPVRGLAAGDTVRLEAGCDKRPDTCRLKFSNLPNFRGFPHLPGSDWVAAVPRLGGLNDGGSMNR